MDQTKGKWKATMKSAMVAFEQQMQQMQINQEASFQGITDQLSRLMAMVSSSPASVGTTQAGQAGDILQHLTPSDAELQANEEECRRAFVAIPASMTNRDDLLLDAFDASVLPSFQYEEGPSHYPQLFTHLQHPTFTLPAGERSVVADLKSFKGNFCHLTGGLFKGVDWSNMVVAGGVVMACLMRPPGEAEDGSDQTAMMDWLGPNYVTRQKDPATGSMADTMHLSSSGFGDSDIDVFFYGLSPKEARRKLRSLLQQLAANVDRPRDFDSRGERIMEEDFSDDPVYREEDDGYDEHVAVVRSEHAVTLVADTWQVKKAQANTKHRPAVHVQVVLRLYSCPAEVLMGFDIDSCCVAYDGDRVFALPRSRRALNRRQNVVDPGRLSPSYESRLAKYARRGFRVAVPGFPGRSRINSSIYLKPFAECLGLARLLRLEQRSIASRAQMGSSISCVRGYKLKPQKSGAAQSHWGMAVTEGAATDAVAVSQAVAGAAGPEAAAGRGPADAQGRQQPEANRVCDYSSLHLPKHLNAMELRVFLAFSAKRLMRAGKPLCMVWQDHTNKGESDFVFNAKPLIQQYPGLQFGIPLQLKWMTTNPGQQGKLTGSFTPLDGNDWTAMAYAEVPTE